MEKQSVEISVIVPVYNVEKYVSHCLESIIAQTFHNIEIIVIDDGSTDDSLSIVQKYAKEDNRIKVFTQTNIGLGPTRNRGITLSNGKFISFVDSDDYIPKNSFQLLYDTAVIDGSDIVQGETQMVYDNALKKKHKRKNLNNIPSITVTENTKEIFYKKYYFSRIYTHNAWDKLYRRDMIINNNIEFGDNARIFSEDNWFQLQLLRCKPKISFVGNVCYIYRQQANSITHMPRKDLIRRQNNMIGDYSHLTSQNDSFVELKVKSLLSFEVIIMELLNQIENGGNFKSFQHALSKVQENSELFCGLYSINSTKAYSLEPIWYKRMLIKLVGTMYTQKMYTFAHFVLWLIYKLRGDAI